MKIEKALDIFKRLQISEYEWFIEESKYLATRYPEEVMDKMKETILDFINEQERENEKLRNLLYTIRNIAKGALIVNTDGILRPIKNTSRQEVYERMMKIRLLLKGNYVLKGNVEAINEILNENKIESEEDE